MNGISLTPSPGAFDLAIQTPGPILLRFSGEQLEALTVACLRAFREGGGKLFQQGTPDVCNVAQDRRWKSLRARTALLKTLADGWRGDAANDNSDFARGVIAGRLGCACELVEVLGQ